MSVWRRNAFRGSSEDRRRDWLARGVDIGIASTVLFAPLFMGGRGPVGRFVFVLCVASTAVLWCVRQCLTKQAAWRKSGVEWLLLAGLGVLVFQLLPLPQSILSFVSPHISELLPLWSPTSESALQLGVWNQVSLHPTATQSGLATYVAYVMLFLVAYQRLEKMQDVQRLLRLIAIATCFMAVVGLAQFFFSNGKFLWVFEHVSRDTRSVVRGPFQNQNHFAHLLALGIGPLLWWIASLQTDPVERRRGASRRLQHSAMQSQILWVALGAVTFTALITFSRGGVVATLVAGVLGVAILAWKQMFSRRAIYGVAAIACLMVASLSIYGYQRLVLRLATLRHAQSLSELSHGRWDLWNAHLKAIPDFWPLGTGVGTHRDIYPTYLAQHFDIEFTHGECGYLQLLLETGVLGAGLFLVGVCIAFCWTFLPLWRSTDRTIVACAAAILPGLVASMVHSLGDFVWYIPACMTTTVLLLAGACRIFHSSATTKPQLQSPKAAVSANLLDAPRTAWVGALVVCLFAFILVADVLRGPAISATHWYGFQRLARAARAANAKPEKSEDLAARVADVAAAVAANPNNAQAQARLADLYLQQFDLDQQHSQNPMPLSQIRDAAFASQFRSKEDLDHWLTRAVGKNRRLFDAALKHARQSVRLCPLQGEAYVLLARTSFLEAPNAGRKRLYIQQALQVRPFRSRVQFAAGQEALLDGDNEKALALWKKAFHGKREVQDELIRMLTAVVPANEVLDALAPSQRGLEALLSHYQNAWQVENEKVVAKYYVRYLTEQLQSDSKIDKRSAFEKLSTLYESLGSTDEAVRFADKASRLAPVDFNLRLRLGRLLVDAGQFEKAQAELQWCIRRQPNHAKTRELLAAANRGSHLQQADVQAGRPGPTHLRQ